MWEPTLPWAAVPCSRNPAQDPRRPNPPLSTTGRATFKASVSSASRSLRANRSPSARLGKHPTAGRMVSTLNRYELAGCGRSTFDTTDSRPRGFLLSCVRKPDVRELRRSARSTPQPFKDMFVSYSRVLPLRLPDSSLALPHRASVPDWCQTVPLKRHCSATASPAFSTANPTPSS